MLSIKSQTKLTVNGGNIDNAENIQILTDFQESLLDKFKNCAIQSANLRESLKENLLQELSIRYVEDMPLSNIDETQKSLIYDMSGYLLKTRKSVYSDCYECTQGLVTTYEKLSENFTCADLEASRNFGGLTFATEGFFNVILLVENVISDFFEDKNHVFVSNCIDVVMSGLCELKVRNPCCNQHEDRLVKLIMYYVKIRFFTEAKHLRNLVLSQSKTKMHVNKKLSRIPSHENKKIKT